MKLKFTSEKVNFTFLYHAYYHTFYHLLGEELLYVPGIVPNAGAAKSIVRIAQVVPQPVRTSGNFQLFTI